MDRPAGVVDFTPSPEHFPFKSRWLQSSVGPVHYVDEGEGRPLLLLHGNPDWSFLYRKIIRGLDGSFRCIAPDYPGFGLSAHPDGYGYTPAEHAGVVGELVDHLGLDDMLVMGQDWGGPIGLDVASRRPGRIHGLIMGNTWFWPADSKLMTGFSKLMSTDKLQAKFLEENFFVDGLMRQTLQAKLSDDEFRHYQEVVPTPEHRRGIAEFPRQITLAEDWLADLQRRVRATLTGKPILLLFGPRDPGLGTGRVIDRWLCTFPGADFRKLDGAGHYIQEDAPDAIVAAIRETFGPG